MSPARRAWLVVIALAPGCDRDGGPACDEGPDCDCPTTPDLPWDRPAEAAIRFEADGVVHAWAAAEGDAVRCEVLDCRHDEIRISGTRGGLSLELSLCGRRDNYEPRAEPGAPCDPETGGFVLRFVDGEAFTSAPGVEPCRVTVTEDGGNLDASFECAPVRAGSGAAVAITTGSVTCALR